ncbi:MAG TPA: aminotransferase class I/II-fold pyridoxal phosphate-dependent enzyme, partial [Thermoplasmata archaeon]|nr:aminotransferase class I/II-fold pyridoxal phosphate-dependent enzyme [Thermoplasmata archaeon]
PEYPPIGDAAREVGFARARSPSEADAVALSSPRNPLGTSVPLEEIRGLAEAHRPVLVDQTFREFTEEPAATRSGLEDLWLSGSYTKVYGADELRVGYAIVPDRQVEGFGRFHGLLLDRLPARSVSGALAILAHRSRLLGEARGLLRQNERYLKSRLEGVPDLAAPVWFDRGRHGLDGDRLAQRLLRKGVLVCAGSYFGDPRGVRIALTRRSFPADLDAYLAVRDRA